MLTVTWQLKPLIVTLHLLFGMTTLALLWWLTLSLPRSFLGRAPRCTARAAPSAAGAPRRYAQRLPPGAPRARRARCCRSRSAAGPAATTPPSPARTFPPARARGGRTRTSAAPSCCGTDSNIDYEGGVLDKPARVAIHLTHRLGALVAACALGARRAVRAAPSRPRRRAAARVGGAGGAGAAARHRHRHGAAGAFRCGSPRRTPPARRCCCWRPSRYCAH